MKKNEVQKSWQTASGMKMKRRKGVCRKINRRAGSMRTKKIAWAGVALSPERSVTVQRSGRTPVVCSMEQTEARTASM